MVEAGCLATQAHSTVPVSTNLQVSGPGVKAGGVPPAHHGGSAALQILHDVVHLQLRPEPVVTGAGGDDLPVLGRPLGQAHQLHAVVQPSLCRQAYQGDVVKDVPELPLYLGLIVLKGGLQYCKRSGVTSWTMTSLGPMSKFCSGGSCPPVGSPPYPSTLYSPNLTVARRVDSFRPLGGRNQIELKIMVWTVYVQYSAVLGKIVERCRGGSWTMGVRWTRGGIKGGLGVD